MKNAFNLLPHKFFLLVLVVSLLSGFFPNRVGAIKYSDYNRILKKYVTSQGMVNYQKLKSSRNLFDNFIRKLGNISKSQFSSFSKNEKIAFWINAYNAFTIKVIIDHYPIKSSFLKSIIYPKNSIRQISGVWDKIKFLAVGKKLTLNQIEHVILRKKFNEPMIHLALVCASIGCPILRKEPYYGKILASQFSEQASRFLAKRKNFEILKNKKRVYISSIFKWFGKDFIKKYATDSKFQNEKKETRAVLNFLSRFVSGNDKKYLNTQKYSVHYLKYNWALNEWK